MIVGGVVLVITASCFSQRRRAARCRCDGPDHERAGHGDSVRGRHAVRRSSSMSTSTSSSGPRSGHTSEELRARVPTDR